MQRIKLAKHHMDKVYRMLKAFDGNETNATVVNGSLFNFIKQKMEPESDSHVDAMIEELFFDGVLFKDEAKNLLFLLDVKDHYWSLVQNMSFEHAIEGM